MSFLCGFVSLDFAERLQTCTTDLCRLDRENDAYEIDRFNLSDRIILCVGDANHSLYSM